MQTTLIFQCKKRLFVITYFNNLKLKLHRAYTTCYKNCRNYNLWTDIPVSRGKYK